MKIGSSVCSSPPLPSWSQLVLLPDEVEDLRILVKGAASLYRSVEELDFLDRASTYAQELPRRLRSALNFFRITDSHALCKISGYPIDDSKIGPTPAHWRRDPERSTAKEEEVFLLLCGALLGDPIGWASQREGLICQDIVPIKGDEQKQIGSNSEQELSWHTEDAFHPYRSDYVGLMCIRNPDEVPTTVASIDDVRLGAMQLKKLFEPRFVIHRDEAHLQHAEEADHGLDDARKRVPVLFGDPRSPYICLDPQFMDCPEDQEAQDAFDSLVRAIDHALTGIVLRPGDVLFIDNYKAVHGRSPFKARFDGTDRWLKRINVARDLRKSRCARRTATSRVIF